MAINKTSNEYAEVIPAELYERIPKAVLAAIAVSFALRIAEDNFTEVPSIIMDEWRALYEAGIVPQAPVKQK